MTAEELRKYVDALEVPRSQLSEYLGVNYRTMSRWLSGDTPVPRMLEIIIQANAIRIKEVKVTRKRIA